MEACGDWQSDVPMGLASSSTCGYQNPHSEVGSMGCSGMSFTSDTDDDDTSFHATQSSVFQQDRQTDSLKARNLYHLIKFCHLKIGN